MSNRSCGVVRDHFVNAVRAEAIAWSIVRSRRTRELADDVREVRRIDVGRALAESTVWPSMRLGYVVGIVTPLQWETSRRRS